MSQRKWAKQVRALPSDPGCNDVLKVEYIEVNLNNSRKLMSNVSGAKHAGTEKSGADQRAVETLLPAKQARSELAWVDQWCGGRETELSELSSSSSDITKSSRAISSER